MLKQAISQVFLWPIILIALYSAPSESSENLIQYERILRLQDNERLVYTDALLAYKIEEKLFLDIKDLVRSVGFELRTEKSSFSFEWEQKESFYEMNFLECFFKSEGRVESFSCDGVLFDGTEHFVEASILEDFLNVKVEHLQRDSVLLISSDHELPKLRIAKLEQMGSAKTGRGVFIPDEEKEPEYRWLDGGSYYQELDYIYKTNRNQSSKEFRHFESLDAEFLNMQLKGNLSGTDKRLDEKWLSLSRESNLEGGIQGTGITSMSLGNFYFPKDRLLPSVDKATGAIVSNESLHKSSGYTFQDFVGELKPGWIVELYQNNILIDRQSSSQDNRYRFEQVPLQYGSNRFVLIFYGPNGQQESIERNFFIDSKLPKAKGIVFTAAAGEVNKKDSHYVNARIPFSSFSGASVTRVRSDEHEILQGNLYTTIWDSFINVYGAQDEQEGGAYGGSLVRRFKRATFRGEYFRWNDFSADKRGPSALEDELNFNIGFSFLPRTYHLLDYSRQGIQNSYSDSWRYRVSHNYKRLFLNNEIRSFGDWQRYSSLLRYRLGLWQVIGEVVGTTLDGINFYQAGLRYQESQKQNLSLIMTDLLKSGMKTIDLSYERIFKKFRGSLSLQTDGSQDHRFSVGFSSSIFADSKSSHIGVRSRIINEIGDVLVKANLKKADGSPGDPVSGVCVNTLALKEKICTDENGFARLESLPATYPIDLTLDLERTANFYLYLEKKKIRYYLRSGKTAHLQVLLETRGEVEGFVEIKDVSQQNISLKLSSNDDNIPKTVYPDRDGYFYFKEVRPGEHKIEVFKDNQRVDSKEVLMPPEGDFIGPINFKL